jgi:hypothetical protein
MTTTADSGSGSLRDAINQINADTSHTLYPSPSNPSVDEIDFNITAASDAAGGGTGFNSATGVATITPQQGLPWIGNAVLIDGYTQPGASPNTNSIATNGQPTDNAGLKIVLDGSQAGPVDGLVITGGNSTVRGLVIDNFAAAPDGGLVLSGGGNDVVTGNFIGTDVKGESAAANYNGIAVSSPGSTIGGFSPEDRNIISGNNFGNGSYGVLAQSKVVIQGNYIGTDKSDTYSLANGNGIEAGVNNTIGGTTAGSGNLISGNAYDGIGLDSQNLVVGNLIGTTATGLAALGNGWARAPGDGIHISGSHNTIGGITAAARNIISGNSGIGGAVGVVIEALAAGGAQYNLVEGNYIGTDITGERVLGTGQGGIIITGANNTIGGSTAAARNIITGYSG